MITPHPPFGHLPLRQGGRQRQSIVSTLKGKAKKDVGFDSDIFYFAFIYFLIELMKSGILMLSSGTDLSVGATGVTGF